MGNIKEELLGMYSCFLQLIVWIRSRKGISLTAEETLENLRMSEELWNQFLIGSGLKQDGEEERQQ
jgi:hypothetical protein